MNGPLLQTKLFIPTVRPNIVSRLRLIDCLNQGLRPDCKLILISAPAGYGKTTLLMEWAQQSQRPTAWLSLDQSDNDPVRFLAYLVAALQKIPGLADINNGKSFLSTFPTTSAHSVKSPSINGVLTSLVNEIAECTEPFALILDDFHVIDEQEVLDAVMLLINNRPMQMNVIVSGRADPPWSLARLRSHRDLTEVRDTDLRFTTGEATEFVNDVMGLNLSQENLAVLEERTEGWIAGLQMASLSMQGRTDVSEFIKAFSGSHRFVLDYLIEEVLEQQSRDTQEFLLKTSILDRLSGPLCDAVLRPVIRKRASADKGENIHLDPSDAQPADDSISQKILNQLEIDNLFVVPLDDERRWYRYHHLFVDLLRAHLSQIQPGEVPVLHQSASAWFESQGLIPEAIKHAVTAGDLDTVERLIAGNVFALVHQRNLNTIASWLDSVPENAIRDRHWLKVTKGWVLTYSGQVVELEQLLREIDLNEGQQLSGHIAAMSSVVASYKGERFRAVSFAREALAQLPENDWAARGFVTGMLAYLLFENGELSAAANTLENSIATSKAADDTTVALMTLCDLAGIQFAMGKLRLTAATCSKALALGRYQLKQRREGQTMPVAGGYAYRRMSQVLQEWNDMDGALHHAKEHKRLYEQGGWFEGLVAGSIRLADIYRSLGDFDRGHDALHTARQLVDDYSPGIIRDLDAHEARLCLAEGDMVAASRWADENVMLVSDTFSFQDMFRYMVLARIVVAQRKLDSASKLLANLLSIAEEAGAGRYIIELLLLQAIARKGRGEPQQALSSMKRALSLAEPEGYIRSFIEPGPEMEELLRDCIVQGVAVTYAGKLLDTFLAEGRDRASLPASLSRMRDIHYVDPLSERELEVLRLLTTSLTQREIAEGLYISVNTLRSHVKRIYNKLNVHNRMAAVRRAQDLDLLG